MKTLAPLLFLGLAVFGPALLAEDINVEFDQARKFSDYKTFAIVDGRINSKAPALNSELVQKRIESEIAARLTAKGLTRVSSSPDLNVRYTLGSANRREVEAYPAGWRGLGTRRIAVRVTEGTLVINLRDTSTKSLVWRAVVTDDENNPSKLSGKLDGMVRKAIDRYPPKTK
jgi:hypothetical protein